MNTNDKSDHSTDLSLQTFVKSFAKEAFHFDKRIIVTVLALFLKPGQLTLSYFRNSEAKYIQPLRLYFAINFVFFLITPILNTPNFQVFNFSMQSLTGSNQTYQEIVKRQIQSNNVSEKIYQERFNAHLKYNQPAFVFLVIPFFALVLNGVNFKSKKYYIEHLFFSIHFLSFFLLFLLIIISLFRILSFGLKYFSISSGVIALILIVALLIGFLVYFAIAMRVFYNSRLLPSILKSVVLFLGFMLTIAGYIQFLFFYTVLALKLGY